MSTQKSKWVFGQPLTSASSGERPAVGYRTPEPTAPSEPEQAGFSGTCDNTSLADWIQLVQMGRRDAVISIRAHDGRVGRLWCQDGDIIDASCDGQVGETAVYLALAWQGGKVSVDFRTFDRHRQIPVATAALLLEAAYRKDSGIRELGLVQRPSSSAPPPPTADLVGNTSTVLPSAAESQSRRRPLGIVLGLAAALGVVVLLTLVLSRSLAPASPEPKQAAGAPEFFVHVEVSPTDAEIALDGEVVAVGRMSKMVPADGRTHEIRCSAPGYASERVVFRDTPFRKVVTLTRNAGVAARGEPSLTPLEPLPPPAPRKAVRSYGPPPRAVAPPAKPKPHEVVKGKLDVEVIERRSPRVQVIDETKPMIEVIE